jgi:NAD(P)-dependent dehydrogenase (short-subunit alcohol dehydrogenase family)
MSDHRHVLITGVSRGLGRALTDEFAQQGHVVTGCARTPAAIHELARAYREPHRFDVVDVADGDQVAAWAKVTLLRSEPPDLMIHCAAVMGTSALLWESDPEEVTTLIDVNVKGLYFVVRSFLPAMVERGSGIIVSMSARWGRTTSPQLAPFCATKWALEGMTRALADELPYGLAAVPLDPGLVRTEMLETLLPGQTSPYPSPQEWAKAAVPFLLELSPADNGDPLTVPL